MSAGIARATALILALVLTLIVARATFAQSDKPASPASPAGAIALPAYGSTSSIVPAFAITQTGSGRAGYFVISNTVNIIPALEARTYSTSSNAIAISAGVMNGHPGAGSAAIVATNYGTGSAGYAIKATHKGNGVAIYAEALAASGKAIYGSARSASGTGSGVYGETFSANGYGVYGTNRNTAGGGYGVYGSGYYGVGGSGVFGVYGTGDTNGVTGYGGTYGIFGSSASYGVYGSGETGVSGHGDSRGVFGDGPVGVYGQGANNGNGVEGHGGSGLYGDGINNGVFATGGQYGIHASGGTYAGLFDQKILVNGHVYSRANFVGIPDPRDDARLIQQAGVISGDQLGMLNGNVVLDNAGRATVTLPAWFSSVYGDYRYNLTPVGDAVLVYVAKEATAGQFIIGGGKPGLKVSWQISGTRQDAAAKADPLKVEVNRADVEPQAPSATPSPPSK